MLQLHRLFGFVILHPRISPSDKVIQILKSLHPEKSDYIIEENLLQEMLECHEALT